MACDLTSNEPGRPEGKGIHRERLVSGQTCRLVVINPLRKRASRELRAATMFLPMPRPRRLAPLIKYMDRISSSSAEREIFERVTDFDGTWEEGATNNEEGDPEAIARRRCGPRQPPARRAHCTGRSGKPSTLRNSTPCNWHRGDRI